MMKEECVSPQCYLPIMKMIGFGSLLLPFGLFVIFSKGMSKFPLDEPSVSILSNL